MTFSNLSKILTFLFAFTVFSLVHSLVYADNHSMSHSDKQQGWFYVGEFNHNTNSFQMSYFNATNYPEVDQRLIANRAVNMRATSPTDKGVLGKKIGIILKNHILVVSGLKAGSKPGGIEDVWVKGYIETAQ